MPNQQMKTLTIDGTTYEIVDDTARSSITTLQALAGAPLTANTVSAMVDTTKVYVYTGSESGYTAGNWYYYSGSAWTSGGVYNSQGIGDGTITNEKLADSTVKLEKLHSEVIAAIGSGGSGSGGINATARSLLMTILRHALYESDQSAVIDAFEIALASSDSGGSGDVTPAEHASITRTLENCTISPDIDNIALSATYQATITPTTDYTIDTVTVVMDGIDITSNAYSNGAINITSVTGDIVIVATASIHPVDLFAYTTWESGYRLMNGNPQALSSYNLSDYFNVEGYSEIYAEAILTNIPCNVSVAFYTYDGSSTYTYLAGSQTGITLRLGSESYPDDHTFTIPQNVTHARAHVTGNLTDEHTPTNAITLTMSR